MSDLTLEEVESIGLSLRMLLSQSWFGLNHQVALQLLDQLDSLLSERKHEMLPLPPNPGLPMFVYGALKPRELAYEQIDKYVRRTPQPAKVSGAALWIRDGLPLLRLDPDSRKQVRGCLLDLDLGGYQAVRVFEPLALYEWNTASAVPDGGGRIEVNVVEGKFVVPKGNSVPKGNPEPIGREWRSADDPVLKYAPMVAFQMFKDLHRGRERERLPESQQSEDASYWDRCFRLQAAYLLLWTVYERLTTLRYGPLLGPMARLRRLENDDAFREAFSEAGAKIGDFVYNSQNLKKVTMRADGSNALDCWYQVRSNLSHRGKGGSSDSQILSEAFVQAHLVLVRLISKLVCQGASEAR